MRRLAAVLLIVADEKDEWTCATACMQSRTRQCCFWTCLCARGGGRDVCEEAIRACGLQPSIVEAR